MEYTVEDKLKKNLTTVIEFFKILKMDIECDEEQKRKIENDFIKDVEPEKKKQKEQAPLLDKEIFQKASHFIIL